MRQLMVWLLIVCPVEMPVPHAAGPAWWTALKQASEALELEPAKGRWIDNWHSEVGWVRKYYRELGDAPPLSDALFLPPREEALHLLAFYLSEQLYYQHLGRIRLHRHEEIQAILEDLRGDAQIWALVESATNAHNAWVCRRQALKQLRELLGPENYYAGQLCLR
jgi:hypothetical protein